VGAVGWGQAVGKGQRVAAEGGRCSAALPLPTAQPNQPLNNVQIEPQQRVMVERRERAERAVR